VVSTPVVAIQHEKREPLQPLGIAGVEIGGG